MKLLNRMSLRYKLISLVSLVSVLCLTILATVLTWQSTGILNNLNAGWTEESARHNALKVQDRLNSYLTSVKMLAISAQEFHSFPPKTAENKLMQLSYKALSMDSGVRCVYYILTRGKYFPEKMTYVNRWHNLSWFRNQDKIQKEGDPADYQVYPTDDYYNIPQQTGIEYLSDPYKYLYTGSTDSMMIASLVAPVMIKGKFAGIAGYDFSVDDLWNTIVSKIKPLGTGYSILISQNGTIAAHPDKKMQGELFGMDMDKQARDTVLANIAAGKEFDFTKVSPVNNELSKYIFSPLRSGNSGVSWSLVSVIPVDKIQEPLKKLHYYSAFASLFLLIMVVILIIYFSNYVFLPIQNIATQMKELSGGKGDLTLRIPVKNEDEVGELAQSFNIFVNKIRIIIEEISGNSANLANSAGELNRISGLLAKGSEQMKTRTDQVSSDTQNVFSNIDNMAMLAKDMNASVNIMQVASEEMTNNFMAMKDVLENMNVRIKQISNNSKESLSVTKYANQKAKRATDTMEQLGASAREIGKVIDVIVRLAQKTNLLALNASIEAASAGKAGAGFAVVAGEIKELALQSSVSAKEISDKITGMQNNSTETVSIISEIVDVIYKIESAVENINDSIEEQNNASSQIEDKLRQSKQKIEDVVSSIKDVTSGANSLAHNASEAARGAQNVSKNIYEVSKSVKESDYEIQKVDKSSEDLKKMTENLKKIVEQFKIS